MECTTVNAINLRDLVLKKLVKIIKLYLIKNFGLKFKYDNFYTIGLKSIKKHAVTVNVTTSQDIHIITPVEIPSEIVHQHGSYHMKHPSMITDTTTTHSDQATFWNVLPSTIRILSFPDTLHILQEEFCLHLDGSDVPCEHNPLMFIGPCIIVIVQEWKTNLKSLAILFHFLCVQHVYDINISIIRSLRLCCWITTLVVLFLFNDPFRTAQWANYFSTEEWKTNLMTLVILFHFLCAQHVSDINISIIRSLRLCCWITTSVVLFSVRCVLEIWCGWHQICGWCFILQLLQWCTVQ